MSDIFTQDIKDLLKLATTDFDKFYEETEKANKGSGNDSTAASSGEDSTAASSGDDSKAASSGDYSTAASSGFRSTAASSGDYSTAASSGNDSTAASSGDYSTAASSGDYSKAESSGENAACSALGRRAAVKGDLGNLLMCSEYSDDGVPLGGKADIVDGKKLKAGSWYIVEGGEWVEVDYTDGIFTRVISSRSGVKKVKDDNGNILYIVTSGEHSAHGKTAKEAREALLFKTADRDTSEYEGMLLDTVKTPMEWAVAYNVITGACEAGCKNFMEQKGKLKSKYTLAEVIKQTEGAYRSERFREFFKNN